jgi:O-antigen ligase
VAAFAEVSLVVLLAALALLTAAVTAAAPMRAVACARYFALLFCAAYSLGVAVRLFAALQLGRAIDLEVLVLGYANPRFPSAFHVALLPLVALVTVDERENRWLRVGATLVLAAVWGINWGLGTRGIWFAYLLALPALALLVGWRRMATVAGVLALTAAAGVACFELLTQLTTSAESAASAAAARPIGNTTLSSREVLWALSWKTIVESPLLGIGPMHFAALGSHVGAHPHNWILQAAAEWGVPAALILGALTVLLVAGMRKRTTAVDVAISCSVLASMTLALVDGNLVMPVTQTAFSLAIGLGLGVSATGQGGDRPATSSALAIAALAASLCVAAYAVSSFPAHEAARDEFRRALPGVWLLPRFWEHSLLPGT